MVKDGEVIHTERVVTGLPDKQTPVFSENLKMIMFQPRWNVPNSIKVRELYPSLARGGTYFQRQGLRLSQERPPRRPRRRRLGLYRHPPLRHLSAGAASATCWAIVKFAFPNKHDVYMHDTPTKDLFEQASRPFSHGCMRVRNPAALAEILLAEDKGWQPQQVAEHGRVRATRTRGHARPARSRCTSPTSRPGSTRRAAVQTASDVYGHEQRITLALEGRFDQIARGPDHLAPVKLDPDVREAIGRARRLPDAVGDFMQSAAQRAASETRHVHWRRMPADSSRC